MDKDVEQLLHNLYYDPSSAAAYSDHLTFFREVKKRLPQLSEDTVKSWLRKQLSFALHLSHKKRFPRNIIIVTRVDEQWQCDLVDMRHLAEHNKGFNYILTVIDVFSRFAWALPLHRKSARIVINAFKKIFIERKPEKIQTDKGLEFNNRFFKNFLATEGVKFFTSHDEGQKCGVIERFNRTLKTRMFRYFTANNTQKYIDVLPKLVDGYNSSFHTSIKARPVEVTRDNAKAIFTNMYRRRPQEFQEPKYDLGQKVRIPVISLKFQKGYRRGWTRGVFTVKSVIRRVPKPMYVLIDNDGKELEKRFYEEELTPI